MGMKLYIHDNKGREFTNLDWALSDTKLLAGTLISKDYLKILKAHLHLNIATLDKVQHYEEIREAGDKLWFDIKRVIEDIQELKGAIEPAAPTIYANLNYTAMELLGISTRNPDFTDDYFVYGGFLGDLDDLERLLYYLWHSGAKKVHFYCA